MFGLFGSKKKRTINTIDVMWNDKFKTLAKQCIELNTDLIEMTEHHPTCAECAKYQGRVYSISGKSKKFPPIPDIIRKKGEIHSGCRHDFYPFFEGISTPAHHKNIVEYSNSPFIDNRSEAEITEYENNKLQQADLDRDRAEYEKIISNLPDEAPKSFAGYRKMKNYKSENYLKLKEKCKVINILLED